MTRKTFMAIHTFHSDEAKQEFFGGMPESETTDTEWAEGWSFEKCRCVATWAGKGYLKGFRKRVGTDGLCQCIYNHIIVGDSSCLPQ